MRLLTAFFKLVRLPNLIFIVLTQSLFQFCIYLPLYKDDIPAHDTRSFILLSLASLFIAAAGYIINDYFDINIDEINKPQKMVVDKIIKRRWAIAWHLMLSITGVLLTALALPVFHKWYLILSNVFCVALLWLYSTSFKKTLLLGNISIGLLTAWTILIIFFSKFSPSSAFALANENQTKFFKISFLYAGFAFIITLIREAIKDIEDMPGDARYDCKTMPIVWGINTSRVYIAVWLIILITILIVVQVYILQFRWWWAIIYCILSIIVPLVYIFLKLFKAETTKDYHKLSSNTKFVMLTGILSMIFFYFY